MESLFIVLLVLKLVGVIQLSWWWVTAPVWAPFALLMFLGTVATVIDLVIPD